MSFSFFEKPSYVLEHPFLLCPVLSHVPFQILAVPAPPGPSRPLVRFLACPVVPLTRDNDGTSVPLSRKTALSHPIGNASINQTWSPVVHYLKILNTDFDILNALLLSLPAFLNQFLNTCSINHDTSFTFFVALQMRTGFFCWWKSILESVQDFLIKLDMKLCMHLVEISTFSLNIVIVRLTKIMNRADKNWAQF